MHDVTGLQRQEVQHAFGIQPYVHRVQALGTKEELAAVERIDVAFGNPVAVGPRVVIPGGSLLVLGLAPVAPGGEQLRRPGVVVRAGQASLLDEPGQGIGFAAPTSRKYSARLGDPQSSALSLRARAGRTKVR